LSTPKKKQRRLATAYDSGNHCFSAPGAACSVSKTLCFLRPISSRSGVHAQAAAASFAQMELWTRASSAVSGWCLCGKGHTHRIWQRAASSAVSGRWIKLCGALPLALALPIW
jgi:hypothetical protein